MVLEDKGKGNSSLPLFKNHQWNKLTQIQVLNQHRMKHITYKRKELKRRNSELLQQQTPTYIDTDCHMPDLVHDISRNKLVD